MNIKYHNTLGWACLLGTLLLLLTAAIARAQVTNIVTVAWDANPEPNIGYVVHYGLTSDTVTNKLRTASLEQSITNLTWNAEHWFFVTATNEWGLESDPSTVLNYTVPAQPVKPAAPTTLLIELKLLSGNQILGPFTNNVANIEYRFEMPMQLFVANIESVKLTDESEPVINISPPLPIKP